MKAPPEGANSIEWPIEQIRANEAAARIFWPLGNTRIEKRLRLIKAPTLLLWGEQDRSCRAPMRMCSPKASAATRPGHRRRGPSGGTGPAGRGRRCNFSVYQLIPAQRIPIESDSDVAILRLKGGRLGALEAGYGRFVSLTTDSAGTLLHQQKHADAPSGGRWRIAPPQVRLKRERIERPARCSLQDFLEAKAASDAVYMNPKPRQKRPEIASAERLVQVRHLLPRRRHQLRGPHRA